MKQADAELVDSENKTFTMRMEEVTVIMAEEIKNCGNACDAYSKKNALVKALMSIAWNDILSRFSLTFTKRSDQIRTLLSIYTTQRIDKAVDLLLIMDKRIEEMNSR